MIAAAEVVVGLTENLFSSSSSSLSSSLSALSFSIAALFGARQLHEVLELSFNERRDHVFPWKLERIGSFY